MQIVEATSLGVRSVLFTLEAEPDKPRFMLFPMVHLAEPEFYAEVRRRLGACDLILFEGVPGLSAMIITLSYRLMAGSPRFGLVSQGAALHPKSFGERAVRADISADAFRREWRNLQLILRASLILVSPAYGLYRRFLGTREQIASRLGTDLLPSRDDILVDEFAEPFLDLIVHVRDRALEQHLDRHAVSEAVTIGVVYGAKHIRAVLKCLTTRAGYRIVDREFLTIMTL